MNAIKWLHISDLHLQEGKSWSQDIVLRALRENIQKRSNAEHSPDFILISGDLAYSGKPAEYNLVATFLKPLAEASGVSPERIFCIPGNHDVDRSRQKLSFAGARHVLQNESAIASILASDEERETLLKRLEAYRNFHGAQFAGQECQWTPDGLAYCGVISVGDVRIAIVGLNSAWLAEGGISDHGKLLLGERQVVAALDVALGSDAHMIVTMGHHPLRLLQEFDRHSAELRIEKASHFYHCGHVHVPEGHDVMRAGSRCIVITAGAGFESREAHNAYAELSVDLLGGQCKVTCVEYNPSAGEFSLEKSETYPFEIDAAQECPLGELADAIVAYDAQAGALAHYLAALLIGDAMEVPVATGRSVAFVALGVVADMPDNEAKVATLALMGIGRAVKLWYGRKPLNEILAQHGAPIGRYVGVLNRLTSAHSVLGDQLKQREANGRVLANVQPRQPFEQTIGLFKQLEVEQDWETLRAQAERHLDAPEATVQRLARRGLALALGHSSEDIHRKRAMELFRILADSDGAEAQDLAALAKLLAADGNHAEATRVVFAGMERFPDSEDGFVEIGRTIVEATGNRRLREELDVRRSGRRTT